MIVDFSQVSQIYLVCGYTDMRKSIDGLAAQVSQEYNLDLFGDSIFFFCGNKRDRFKALYWDGDGFLLLYKRLEGGKFQWPRSREEARKISHRQLRWLLEGLSIEQPKEIQPAAPGAVC